MLQNQLSTITYKNRYPKLFQLASFLLNRSGKVLSFGCSSGAEVRTLRKRYFINSTVHGIDINKELIAENIEENDDQFVKYFDDMANVDNDYDIIFCMSVLCRWPESDNIIDPYKFEIFEQTLIDIDKRLKIGGYLVIYNSSFCFNDTVLSSHYRSINYTNQEEPEYVTKTLKDGTVVQDYTYVFRKLNQYLPE
jgi:hypothetical protein